MKPRALLAGLVLALSALPAPTQVFAQDSGIVTIEGTRIRGDQEVPTVMYLVPWQPPEVEALQAPDERLLVDQAFAPVERYEFQRLLRYHQAFRQQQEEGNQTQP